MLWENKEKLGKDINKETNTENRVISRKSQRIERKKIGTQRKKAGQTLKVRKMRGKRSKGGKNAVKKVEVEKGGLKIRHSKVQWVGGGRREG
jgi:hypothetical protein